MDKGLASQRHGRVWGALISCLPISDFLLRPSFRTITTTSFDTTREVPFLVTVAYLTVMLLLAVPISLALRRFGVRLERGLRLLVVLLPLVVLVPASLIGEGALRALPNLILMEYTFIVMMMLAVIRYDESFIRGFLGAAAVGHAVALVMVIGYGEYTWGRLTSRNSPNFWGFTAVGAILAALAVRQWWQRLAIIAIGAVTLYLTQARGSLIAVSGGLCVAFVLAFIVAGPRRRIAMGLGCVFTLAVGGLVLGPVIADRLLLVNDAERGLDSGGTGRAGAWREAAQLIADNPLLGVGFRQHNAFITRASSAHNAYLTVGAELGLFGLAAYAVLLVGAALRAMRRYLASERAADMASAAYLSAFALLGMLETYSLNTSSALMLLLVAWSWGDRVTGERAGARPPGATPKPAGAPGLVAEPAPAIAKA